MTTVIVLMSSRQPPVAQDDVGDVDALVLATNKHATTKCTISSFTIAPTAAALAPLSAFFATVATTESCKH